MGHLKLWYSFVNTNFFCKFKFFLVYMLHYDCGIAKNIIDITKNVSKKRSQMQ